VIELPCRFSATVTLEWWRRTGNLHTTPVQNLTYSCSATSISYKGNEILCVSRINFEIPILGYLRVWGYFWGI